VLDLFIGYLLVMPLGFGAISTDLHAAPAPTVIAAGVNEQKPAAAIIRAFTHLVNIF